MRAATGMDILTQWKRKTLNFCPSQTDDRAKGDRHDGQKRKRGIYNWILISMEGNMNLQPMFFTWRTAT